MSEASILDELAKRDQSWARLHEIPPDAGDSVLAAFGLKNWIVVWLMQRAPELLAWTPRQLVKGLRAPHCPKCWNTMSLRVAEKRGRTPKRLVWRCYRHGTPPRPVTLEIELAKMPRPRVNMREILAATRRGAIVDFQRTSIYTPAEIVIREKPKARCRR